MDFDIQIDRNSDIAIYRQIIERIVLMVKNGELKAGDKLPPERELANITGIARGTIKKAYEELERDKIIEVIQGRGSFVSQKQEVLGKDRKETAIRTIDDMLTDLEALGFSYREISTLIKIRISEREKRKAKVRIAAVDCNAEALSIFENQLSYISNISFTRFLLDDLSKFDEAEALLSENDIILTTSTHYSELCGMAKSLKSRIFKAAVSPSQQTIIDIATIPAEAGVGILCKSEKFLNIITSRLKALKIKNVYGMLEGKAKNYSKFLDSINILIIPPDFEQQADKDLKNLTDEFVKRGGRLIKFEYQIERGSLIYLEEEISNILNAKG